MRVLHVVPSLDPELGGPTEVVKGLTTALCRAGISVEILSTSSNSSVKIPNDTVPHHLFPPSIVSRRQFIPSIPLTQWFWRNARSFDLIDIHYLFTFTTLVGSHIAYNQSVPYTMRSMGQLAPWALLQSKMLKRAYSALVERTALNRASAIQCTSSGEEKEVSSFGVRTPCTTIGLGVELPVNVPNAREILYSQLKLPTGAQTVLFLSRLHPKKQPEVLIEAVSKLRRNLNLHLLVAGNSDPHYLQSLEVLTKRLKVSDRVHFVGFATGQFKELLLQGSDLFALPSVTENFGIAVAEALIRGKPCILSRGIQIAPELQNCGAAVVLEPTVSEFAGGIELLLGDPTRRSILSTAGESFARTRYSWHFVAQETISLYEKIIGARC